MRHEVSLMTFLRGSSNPEHLIPGCSCYDHAHGGCLYDEFCWVEQGQRCPWFEKAVLPTATDTGQQEHIYSLYESHVDMPGLWDRNDARLCPDCLKAELAMRQRYCPDCTRKRRLKTKRENQRKYRAKHKVCA